MIFVNSMSDLFHEEIPLEYIEEVFDVMGQAERHMFQILTKRHERLAELAGELTWPRTYGSVSRSRIGASCTGPTIYARLTQP